MFERQRLNLKHGIVIVTFLKFVIRDSRAQMMDMMETNIPCEPLQHFGKFIEGAAIHTGVEELPFRVTFPIRGVKIMLDIEEPDARAAGDEQDRYFDQKESCPRRLDNFPLFC